MREVVGDKVHRKVYRTVKEFIQEQRDIERTGIFKREGRFWTQNDELRIKNLEFKLEALLSMAKQDRSPKRDKGWDRFYKHKITREQWKIETWVHPNGEVVVVNQEVPYRVKLL